MAKFYKQLHKTRIKTGIWTLSVLLILLLGYLWLTNRLQLKRQQEIQVVFSNVMGLDPGDKIMYRGMEAGRVKSIALHKDGILVSGKISTMINIPQDSRFYIEDSLMGSKSLNIEPGQSEEHLDLNYIQIGENPTGMMTMIAKAGRTLEQVDDILEAIRREGGILDHGERLVKNADYAIYGMKGSVDRLKVEFLDLIEEVNTLTSRVGGFLDESKEPLLSSIRSAPATMKRVNTALDSLSLLSAKLNRSVDAVISGEGSAGKLLADDELYQNLLESVNKLDNLIEDIKKNPQKYIKISVF